MPELPEVEILRQYLEETSLHQKIVEVAAEDPKRQVTLPLEDFQETLKGRSFVSTTRIGKHLLVRLDNGKVLSLHFGMTGDLHYYRLSEEAPRFGRVTFFFDSGFKLAFVDSRKFGRVGIWDSEEAYLKAKGLGPDALEIGTETLFKSLKKRKSPLKPALLDQKILAGIGNWLVDEILYQARLHPEMIAAQLTMEQANTLHQAMQHVLKTAIEKEVVYRDLPASFLIHSREWDDSPHPETNSHKHCPRCETAILKTVVGGRATYLCSTCQKL